MVKQVTVGVIVYKQKPGGDWFMGGNIYVGRELCATLDLIWELQNPWQKVEACDPALKDGRDVLGLDSTGRQATIRWAEWYSQWLDDALEWFFPTRVMSLPQSPKEEE
jgi:hypothetical protein